MVNIYFVISFLITAFEMAHILIEVDKRTDINIHHLLFVIAIGVVYMFVSPLLVLYDVVSLILPIRPLKMACVEYFLKQ